MKNKNIFSVILIVVFIFVVFFLINSNYSNILDVNKIKYVKIGDAKIKVDLAKTAEQQEKGLSIKNSLKDNEGMLFIFSKASIHHFWMKGMVFPIDIIWINDDFKIIYIEKNVQPDSYPQTFGPNKESRYVLEIKALFSEKNNLKEGDIVQFLPS